MTARASASEQALLVDSLLREPAVVLGSLPPHGRDLDLLLPPDEVRRLPGRLRDAGFVNRGSTWVLFAHCTAYAVDVYDLAAWAPTAEAARALRADARPVPGFRQLLAPGDPHRILLLAQRRARGMTVDDRKRATLATFADADWERAEGEAGAWGLAQALQGLRSDFLAPSASHRPVRRRLLPARTTVVALSGLDGSGKSTQVHNLQAALDRLGHEAEVEWTKIARDALSRSLGRWAKGVIGRSPLASRLEEVDEPPPSAPEAGAGETDGEVRVYPDGLAPAPPDAGRRLRHRSRLLTWTWALVIAVGNGLDHRRAVRRHAGRVVICDRYVLDTLVHLHYRYGDDLPLWLHRRIVRWLSPRPAAAFFLDVPAEVARARKPEQYLTPELAIMRERYQRHAGEAGAVVLDGTRPIEDVAAEIARRTWRATSGRSRRWRRLVRRGSS
jgi:thymidylate kinase